jgi:tetratricopeptide (TPR) repeat protein
MMQRSGLHERAAEWLDLGGRGRDELVGYHLERAYRCRIDLAPPDQRTRHLADDAGRRLAAAGLRAAKSGDVHAAANLLTRASSLLQKNELTRYDLLTELGLVLWQQGGLGDAAETLGTALESALSAHDRRAELRARLELANLRLFRAPEGGADEVLSLAAEAIPVLKGLGDERSLGRFWYVLAFVHGGLHCHYRESEDAAEQAKGYFLRSGWPVASCLQEIAACIYYGPTSVPTGIRRCRGLIEESDRGGEAHVMAFLAGLEGMAGRFSVARDLVSRAQGIYEELGWTMNISTNYASLAADIELLAGDFAEAERILNKSCANLEAWGEQSRLATQATQLGEALHGLGRHEEALRRSEMAEDYAASDDAGAQFSWRALRAKTLARRGSFREAETLAREAAAIAATTDAVTQRANVLLSYAEVLSLEGRGSQALEPSNEAMRLLEGKRNLAGSRKAHSQLRELASA